MTWWLLTALTRRGSRPCAVLVLFVAGAARVVLFRDVLLLLSCHGRWWSSSGSHYVAVSVVVVVLGTDVVGVAPRYPVVVVGVVGCCSLGAWGVCGRVVFSRGDWVCVVVDVPVSTLLLDFFVDVVPTVGLVGWVLGLQVFLLGVAACWSSSGVGVGGVRESCWFDIGVSDSSKVVVTIAPSLVLVGPRCGVPWSSSRYCC